MLILLINVENLFLGFCPKKLSTHNSIHNSIHENSSLPSKSIFFFQSRGCKIINSLGHAALECNKMRSPA